MLPAESYPNIVLNAVKLNPASSFETQFPELVYQQGPFPNGVFEELIGIGSGFPNLVLYSLPMFFLVLGIEIFIYKLKKREYQRKDALVSVSMGLLSLPIGMLFKAMNFAIFFWAYNNRIYDFGMEWWALFLALMADDFRIYVFHRIRHNIRYMWCSHVNHHSSEQFNYSTALRQSWTANITGQILFKIPFAFLGFHPLILIMMHQFHQVYQFFLHTELIDKMPRWFEYIMNTPSHHRVHHASNPRYLNANYGATFIIWDRMFGTYVHEFEGEKVKYGITKNIKTFNIFKAVFHEYVSVFKDVCLPNLTLKERFLYLFGNPGYSHDDAGCTAKQQRIDFLKAHPELAGTPGLPHKYLQVIPTTDNNQSNHKAA